ncbi:ACP S-malonyltransferase [Planctomycetota bacterium]
MGKVAFLFPGQGAQQVGMGQQLCESMPAAKALFEQANEILGYDLASVCFEGPSEKLNSTVHSQPALFVTSMAALEKMKAETPELGGQCEIAAGLSLGEYTALTFAGVMEFADALRVVQCRGEAMQAASDECESGMVSLLGLELEQIEKLCDEARLDGEILQVANHLCPGNIAVSGQKASCEAVGKLAHEAGAMKVIPLAVAGAFHTPVMQSAVQKLTDALASVNMKSPRIPVVSNVDARTHHDPEEIRDLLVRQVVQPVLWEKSVRSLLDDGVDHFYEIGTGRVLRGLLKRISRKSKCDSISA